MQVADLSVGTELIAGSTGWAYEVVREYDTAVVCRGPRGPIVVDRDELQQNIAEGRVEVRA